MNETLHQDVLQLISNMILWIGPFLPGETKPSLLVVDWDIGIACAGKACCSLTGRKFEIGKAKAVRLRSEVKLKGLSQCNETLVTVGIKGLAQRAVLMPVQAHCDRADLMADYYDSAWFKEMGAKAPTNPEDFRR